MQQHGAAVLQQRIGREHALFLVRPLARRVILPVEKQVDDRQLAQIPPPPRIEVLIQLLRDAADRALAQAAPAERVGEEGADVPGR